MRERLKYALDTTRMLSCVSAFAWKREENIIKLNIYFMEMIYRSKSHLRKVEQLYIVWVDLETTQRNTF